MIGDETDARLNRLEAWLHLLMEKASPEVQRKAVVISKGLRPCTESTCTKAWRPGILSDGSLVPTPCEDHE